MQTRKNKTYKLMTRTVKVQYEDKVLDDNGDWIYGRVHWNGSKITIFISTKDEDGEELSDDVIETTIRHELFHLILDVLYFRDLSENETLVEWLANATYELKKQGLPI